MLIGREVRPISTTLSVVIQWACGCTSLVLGEEPHGLGFCIPIPQTQEHVWTDGDRDYYYIETTGNG